MQRQKKKTFAYEEDNGINKPSFLPFIPGQHCNLKLEYDISYSSIRLLGRKPGYISSYSVKTSFRFINCLIGTYQYL